MDKLSPKTSNSDAIAGTTVHEIGHQFTLEEGDNGNNHVDKQRDYPNHENSDECVMSHNTNIGNGVAEFCDENSGDCIDDIRSLADGI